MGMNNLCEVCGCRLTNWCATTCDPVCTRAKRAGLTRGQQMFYDVKYMTRYARLPPLRPTRTEENYNQPYLRRTYAA